MLFVNWQGQQKCKTYFDRKYPNALRADGTVTWWPPKNFDEERLSEPLHLFGRRGKSNFLYLGRLAYVGPLAGGRRRARRFSVEARRRRRGARRRADDGDARPGLQRCSTRRPRCCLDGCAGATCWGCLWSRWGTRYIAFGAVAGGRVAVGEAAGTGAGFVFRCY